MILQARQARTANRFAPRQQRSTFAGGQIRWYFSPLILLWLDAASNPVPYGTAVGAWSDLIGSANATQALSSKQPLHASKDNIPSMQFDGVNDCLVTPSTTWNDQAVSVYTVRWLTDSTNKNLFERSTDFNYTQQGFVVYGRSTEAGLALQGNAGYSGASQASAQNRWLCNASIFDKAAPAVSELASYQNGVSVTLTPWSTANNTGTFGSLQNYIGSRNNGAAFAVNGWLSSVLVLRGASAARQAFDLSILLSQRAGIA
jgi:hypothetical protein